MPISASEFQNKIDLIVGDDAAESEQAYRDLDRYCLTQSQREYAEAVYKNSKHNLVRSPVGLKAPREPMGAAPK